MARIPEGGYQLEAAINYGRGLPLAKSLIASTKTRALVPTIEAYVSNMKRVSSIPMMVADAIVSTTVAQRATGMIPIVRGVPNEDLLAFHAPRTQDEAERIKGEFATRVVQLQASILEFVSPNPIQATLSLGAHMMENQTAMQMDQTKQGGRVSPLAEGTEAMFFAMVFNSYAAFEVLAGDLWIATVNLHPELYTDKDGADEKIVTLGDLRNFDYNIQGRIGEFAKASGRVSFQSASGMKAAYKELFGSTSDPYRALKNNTELVKTEKVRHLIAHQSGKVDAKFLREMKGTEFENVPLNQSLPLNGQQVSKLIDSCLKTSIDLVKSVDAWVVTYEHRPK